MACVFCLGACSWLGASLTRDFGKQFASTVANSDDPKTVAAALPAYLLTLDSMLADSKSASLFWAGAKLNSLYGGQFVMDREQKLKLIDKSWKYGQRAACLEDRRWCGVVSLTQAQLQTLLHSTGKNQVSTLYYLGSLWAGWIEVHSDDWNAVAKIGQVQLIMEKVVALDEGFESGSAHLYLGVLATLVPPALGGKPEVGRQHFERAIELSSAKNLMAKVLYAKNYGRLIFDQGLHNRLLNEVLSANPHQEGFALANTLAQQQARQLLDSGNEYF